MAQENLTIFQRLTRALSGQRNVSTPTSNVGNTYNINRDDDIIDVAYSPEEYKEKLLQHRQNRFLANQWMKTTYDIDNRSLAGLNDVRLMYRDCDLMDGFPEIGAALDIAVEEVCTINEEGKLINVESKSERIKSILEDLFVNRLSLSVVLPMIVRSTIKYGNDFLALNIATNNGIIGWKELPVYEVERYEDGMEFPYKVTALNKESEDKLNDTRFVWVGSSQALSYKNFQIAHFRLLYDSQFLPYGVSWLNKARRHFRLLSMMEDLMFIYRLDRSVERRVFKINVGAIDSADVKPFIDQVADKFKRAEIIDPKTGQIDTRKNILNVMQDFFIPTLPGDTTNPIETLASTQSLTAMDDIQYMQNKICSALRIPKAFLNFEESQGEGKNLSLLDIRFAKTVIRIQQAILSELNKVAIIHLTLLGFMDEITNFRLSMNTSSHSVEMLELENLAKKVTLAKDAVADAGNGIPLMSIHYVWEHVFHWSKKQIKENLEQLRLEAALAVELQKTMQIIKKTNIFDPVDNIYGEPGAEYADDTGGEEGGSHGGGPSGGGGGGIPPMMGGDLDFGDEGMAEGAEGEIPMNQAAEEDVGPQGPPPMGESKKRKKKKPLITEGKKVVAPTKEQKDALFNNLVDKLLGESKNKQRQVNTPTVPLYDKNFFINQELNSLASQLKSKISEGVVSDYEPIEVPKQSNSQDVETTE